MVVLYPDNLYHLLEFDQILNKLSERCHNPAVKEQTKVLQPIPDFDLLSAELQKVREYQLSIQRNNRIPFYAIGALEKEFKTLHIDNALLDVKQLLQVQHLAKSACDLLKFFKGKELIYPCLYQYVQVYQLDNAPFNLIDEVLDQTGYVKSTASKTLASIRESLSEKRRQCDRLYKAHISRLNQANQLADFKESFINGRRVLSVLAEFKREVKGQVQGYSSSGRIVYIEPLNLISLNNDIVELEHEEKIEIYTVLRSLIAKLRPYESLLLQYYQMMLHFDLLNAKAQFAVDIQANLPRLHKEGNKLQLINAYHPLLFLQNKANHKKTMPIRVNLDEQNRILVISGPNAGGKSVSLKTVGLSVLMLQCGLLIAADEKSELSCFQQIFADIGDSQNIEDGLSTYSSRLIKMKYFLKRANASTLFLIDEFGTGSDPDLGGALAEAILLRLNENKSCGIITTHYTNLKIIAANHQGIQNAHMQFDPKSLQPMYNLISGVPGSSFTFEVAEKIGLNAEVIDHAKHKINIDQIKINTLLADLQKEKMHTSRLNRDLQKQMGKLAAEKREYQALNKLLHDKIDAFSHNKTEKVVLQDMGKKLTTLIQEWEENKNKKEVIGKFVKLAGYNLIKKREQEKLEKSTEYKKQKLERIKANIAVGSMVRLMRSKEIGIVQSVEQNKAKVMFGKMPMTVDFLNLELV